MYVHVWICGGVDINVIKNVLRRVWFMFNEDDQKEGKKLCALAMFHTISRLPALQGPEEGYIHRHLHNPPEPGKTPI